jgi:hypothetical protein
MKKSIFIFFILFFNYLSISFAEDNFIEKPINSINNLSKKIAKVPFKLLKETAKKITSVGTKPLLFGMATVTMLSSGIEDNNQNVEKLENKKNNHQIKRVKAKGQINLNGLDENEAKRRALEDALYYASIKAGVKVQGFSSIDEYTNLSENFVVQPDNQILDYKILNSYKKENNFIVEIEAMIGNIRNTNNACVNRKLINIKEFKGNHLISSSAPSWSYHYLESILYQIRRSMEEDVNFNYISYSSKEFDFNKNNFDKSFDYNTLVNGAYEVTEGEYIYIPSFKLKKSKILPKILLGKDDNLNNNNFFDADAISITTKIDIYNGVKNTHITTIEEENLIPINIDSNFKTVELFSKRDKERLNNDLKQIANNLYSSIKKDLSCKPIIAKTKIVNDKLEISIGSKHGLRKNQLAILDNTDKENSWTMLSISKIEGSKAVLTPLNSKIKLEDLSGKNTRFLE